MRPMARAPLNLYSDEDLDRLHAASLRVLEEVGARIMTAAGRELLLDAGCTLAGEGLVKVPRALVERAIETAPSHFTLYDRNGEPAIALGDGYTYIGTGVTNLNYLHPG